MSDKSVIKELRKVRDREIGSIISRQRNLLEIIEKTEHADQYDRCLSTYQELETYLMKKSQEWNSKLQSKDQ